MLDRLTLQTFWFFADMRHSCTSAKNRWKLAYRLARGMRRRGVI